MTPAAVVGAMLEVLRSGCADDELAVFRTLIESGRFTNREIGAYMDEAMARRRAEVALALKGLGV